MKRSERHDEARTADSGPCRQLAFLHFYRILEQMDLRPSRLPKHDVDLHSFPSHFLGSSDVRVLERFQAKAATFDKNGATFSGVLRICCLHELESAEQHCGYIPTGQSTYHSCYYSDPHNTLQQRVFNQDQVDYCE